MDKVNRICEAPGRHQHQALPCWVDVLRISFSFCDFCFFARFFFSRSTLASPLKIGRIEPALRTEVQHAQIHRLVSVGHRLLCEKILTVKKPCRPIIEHASLFSHCCFWCERRCERRCGRSSPPLCFSYPRRPSLLMPVNTRAHARTAVACVCDRKAVAHGFPVM